MGSVLSIFSCKAYTEISFWLKMNKVQGDNTYFWAYLVPNFDDS